MACAFEGSNPSLPRKPPRHEEVFIFPPDGKRTELRFDCQRCSACCTGSPGAVWLAAGEPERLSARLGMELSDFIADYCVWIGQGESARLSLREKEGWDCVFLAPSGCLVYEDRPIQCRAYPFWESLVSDPGAWESEARYCPGIGRGEAVDAERIASLLLEQRAASPWRAEAARGAEREDGKR